MKSLSLCLLVLALAPGGARAAGFELAGSLGRALPRYEQTFLYDPGDHGLRMPGVTIREQGRFRFQASGGLVFSGAATLYISDGVGLEARVDSATADGDITGAGYDVTADLPDPFPDVSTTVALPPGTAEIPRFQTYSANLKLRTAGTVRFAISGGLSYLPKLDASASQPLALGVSGFSGAGVDVDVIDVRLLAEALPERDDRRSRLGVNAGLGLQAQLSPRLALAVEARGFLFKKHRLSWALTTHASLDERQIAILQSLVNRLDPAEFNPSYIQATAGLALTF